MLIYLLFLSLFSTQESNSLHKVWEKQQEIKHEWQTYSYQYIQFTKENKMSFLNGFGEIVESYKFSITEDSLINLSNGEQFGKLIKLTDEELIIEKVIKRGNIIPIISNSYLEIVETSIEKRINNVSEHISNNEWNCTLSSNSFDSVSVSLKFDQFDISKGNFNVQSNGVIKGYEVKVENFNKSFSIFLNDKEKPSKSDFYKINRVGMDEIHITFYESSVGKMVLKRKKV